ncbi:MAG: 4Fe-4S dicluster domain-containing protein [Actinobacteria bacterium]|nr:4Fe-4S dicluster domain-containing protein [Actinomycetota bacterium]
MEIRKIIEIDEDKCNGCGLCIPNCPEGALQVIDGKARLISDLFCDGLGACIGQCPQEAIRVIEKEAEPYSESKVMENIVKRGKNTIVAHLRHLKEHNEMELFDEAIRYLKANNQENPLSDEEAGKVLEDAPDSRDRLPCGCPGTVVMNLREKEAENKSGASAFASEKKTVAANAGLKVKNMDSEPEKIEKNLKQKTDRKSRLGQWPVQITLVPSNAPYLRNARLLIAADCVPFAYAGFHEDMLDGKILLVGCPKLDDSEFYLKKITEILRQNDLKSITVAHMEVPCCFGMLGIVRQALKDSGKDIPVEEITIGIKGNVIT